MIIYFHWVFLCFPSLYGRWHNFPFNTITVLFKNKNVLKMIQRNVKYFKYINILNISMPYTGQTQIMQKLDKGHTDNYHVTLGTNTWLDPAASKLFKRK